MDSNHRSEDATDLQSAPFGHSGTLPYLIGAGGRIRTPDLLITNQLLYQLSYTSISAARSVFSDPCATNGRQKKTDPERFIIIANCAGIVNTFYKIAAQSAKKSKPYPGPAIEKTLNCPPSQGQ